ncbi:hypothetical protein [Streptomyces sp. JB150]|uniref:hypothetical protein n=1 Tax=Streptomyces sp. JB150 TaxID=2714844 RepID=UPI001F1170A5|nr:hypothetical protein [Streptomyces sp. JB150]
MARAAAAGLGGVLLLGACGGGSEEEATPTAPAASSPSPSPSPSASGSAAGGELDGSWLATSGGQAVVLVFNGDEAGLFASRGTVCGGRVTEAAGKPAIRLLCGEGGKNGDDGAWGDGGAGGEGGRDRERGTGTVDSVTADSLKVTWEGSAGVETFTRAEGGTLPSGVPTEGLGS